jgi:predicted DNA-binding protein (MmcQ/YjbR family)
MFAVAGREGDAAPRYAVKASDASFEQLVEEGAAIPAPYLARAKWVQFTGTPPVSEDQLLAYLRQAHALVAAKLSGKRRLALGVAS